MVDGNRALSGPQNSRPDVQQEKRRELEAVTIEFRRYPDGDWFASIPQMPGCMTEADSLPEAMSMIRDAYKEWSAVDDIALDYDHLSGREEP